MRGAQLEAAGEAAMRQAEGASKAAKSLMNAVRIYSLICCLSFLTHTLTIAGW